VDRLHRFAVALLLACSLSWLSAAANLRAEGIASDKAVEAGREALDGSTNYPWYDREKDAVRRVDVKSPKRDDIPGRESKWSAKTKSNPTTTTGGGPTNTGGPLGPILQGLGLALLVALLVTIAILIARAALSREASGEGGGHVVETSHEVDRVENLPFQVKRPTGDFLSESQRLYEAGRYSEAIVYLFSYQLVQLDKHHHIRLTKGKTNRQYLRELRHRPALRGMLEPTMIAFEDVFFGHHQIDRERFESCWRLLEPFQQEVQRAEQVAA
jgi:hypothetical protein